MKRQIKKIFRVISILSLFALSSCANQILSYSPETKDLSITGTIELETSAFPKEITDAFNFTDNTEKTAFPSFTEVFDYTVCAKKLNADGTIDSSFTPLSGIVTPATKTYTISIPQYGSYKIFVEANINNKLTLQGESEVITISEDTTIATPKTISLKPLATDTGKGSIELKINYSLSSQPGIKIKLDNGEWINCTDTTDHININSNYYTIQFSDITSGTHNMQFQFYDASNNILYFCKEVINVFDNLETDTWNGTTKLSTPSPHLTYNSTNKIYEFTLTESCLLKFASTTFYVNPLTTTGTYASGSDTNSGSYFSPFKTIKRAINAIKATGNTTESYTIYLMNDITLDETNKSDLLDNNCLIYPSFGGERTVKICSIDDTKKTIKDERTATLKSTLIKIPASSELIILTLENLKISGCQSNDSTDPSVISNSGANLTLSNVDIEDCKSIYTSSSLNSPKGAISCSQILNLSKVKFNNCSTTLDSTSGLYDACGGAIFSSGSLTIDECTFENCFTEGKNKACAKGGAIYFQGLSSYNLEIKNGTSFTGCYAKSASSNVAGGTIYISNGKILLDEITISGCYVTTSNETSFGGAIYNGSSDADNIIKNSTIENCHNKNDNKIPYGGAIYNDGKLTLSGTTIIKNCYVSGYDKVYGGGIHNEGTLTINDAVISGCYAQTITQNKNAYGGGICNYYSGSTVATCTINKGIITGCEARYYNDSDLNYDKSYGGAILNAGTLTLGDETSNSNGSPDVIIGIGTYGGKKYISPNKAISGAGVYSNDSTATNINFTMNSDCVIGKYETSADFSNLYGNVSNTQNNVDQEGIGLYLSRTAATINGGYISWNKAENTCSTNELNKSISGVGVYYYFNNPAEFKNLTISYNYADNRKHICGIGMQIKYNNPNQYMTLTNIKIFGNSYNTLTKTTTTSGKGIYCGCLSTIQLNVTSYLILKGNTWLSDSNDISLLYYPNDAGRLTQIVCPETLTPIDNSGNKADYVATVTPAVYQTVQYLAENTSGTASTYVAENCNKFKVNPYNGTDYIFGSDGKLYPKLTSLTNDTKGSQTTFYIADAKDFIKISDYNNWTLAENEKYILSNDIILSSSENIEEPLALKNGMVFDGNNHQIKGLTRTPFNINNNFTTKPVIQNLTVEGTSQTSGIAGNNWGKIINCISNMEIKHTNSNATEVGGIVQNNYGEITNCKNYGNITSTITKSDNYYFGGIAGSNNSTGIIDKCINQGSINNSNTNADSYAGGIAGKNQNIIQNCSNKSTIENAKFTGGIVGNLISSGRIYNCYNIATLTPYPSSNSRVGGICGLSEDNTKIILCYNLYSVFSTSTNYKGGIVGQVITGSPCEYCFHYNTASITGIPNVDDSTDNQYSEKGCRKIQKRGSYISQGYKGSVDNNLHTILNTVKVQKLSSYSDWSTWKKHSDGYPCFNWE